MARPPSAAGMRLALIGDPVAHSESPALHRGFMQEAGFVGTYEAVRVPAGEGARALDELGAAGFRGVNVTTPLKEEAFARCAVDDALARASGSVNTVVFAGGRTLGYNTDGAGALGAVRAALVQDDLTGIVVAVLGAGPTARASIHALLDCGARVVVWNRTKARADTLAERFAVDLWAAGIQPDLVLSTLAPVHALEDEALVAMLSATPHVVDANYGTRATLERLLGRPVADGREMLRASARASFDLFAHHHRREHG